MKFKYKCLHAITSENDSSVYDVNYDEEFTIKDFAQFILETRKRDWGEIYINFRNTKNMLCEYSRGEFKNVNNDLFNTIVDKKIKQITAIGDCGYMKYLIFTDDPKLIQALEKIEELEKSLKELNDIRIGLNNIVEEKENIIKTLKTENERMKNADLWQRIRGWNGEGHSRKGNKV